MNKWIVICFSQFVFFGLSSQIDRSFLKYLLNSNLKTEHWAYLEQIEEKTLSDTFSYCKAEYFIKYFDAENFLKELKSNKKLILQDTLLINRAAKLFLTQPVEKQRLFNETVSVPDAPYYTKSICNILNASVSINKAEQLFIPDKLKASHQNLINSNRKKPLVSALLSAVFPGAGKLYIGRTRSFINVLVAHVFNSLAVYETIKNFGPSNAYSVFCVSYSGIFYLANVFGSANDVKQSKIEKRKQFLHDASNYYNSLCPFPADQ
jgi:hypothetical protein